MSCVLLFAAAAIFHVALCNEVLLSTVNDFVDFMNSVNSGNDYKDDTVLLDNSLNFEDYKGTLVPIGTMGSFFSGVFNGQGNLFSNLHINTTERLAGLFGYTQGATIKNFMLDETCSIESTHESLNGIHMGGALGRCYTHVKHCVFDNAVNKATITFSGKTESDIVLGGVIGTCIFADYYCSIKNCANFATVTNTGTTDWFTEIGGVVGICSGTEDNRCKLHNNLNYGDLYNKGTSKDVIMGGIVANMYSTTNVQSCVNLGKIYNESPGRYNHIGGIAGYAYTEVSSLARNYWGADVGADSAVGFIREEALVEDSNIMTSPNEDMILNLNKVASSNNWNMWALNLNHATFQLELNGWVIFSSTLDVIHLPNLATYEGYHFTGFYLDHEHTEPMTNFIITEDTKIHSIWIPKDYSVEFVFNETYNETLTITFATKFDFPKLPERDGYIARWCTDDLITCDPERMPPYDLVLYPTYTMPESSSSSSSDNYAEFNNSASRYVRIVFKLESMYTTEVEDVIRKYGGESTHEVISIDEDGLTTVVVIRFDRLEDAIEFIEGIRESKSQAKADKIHDISYLDESLYSYSVSILPFLSLYLLFM